MNRVLIDDFKEDLLHGKLSPLLKHITSDNTLMLAIREEYINIYYRGGNILRLKKEKTKYKPFFDNKYAADSTFKLPKMPEDIASQENISDWIAAFPTLKQIMDCWFTQNQKMEREFQQLVVRENNYSPISNGTEYFITDIEMAESKLSARFDMLAFKWTAAERKTDEGRLALIEMKYGDKALQEKSGIIAHLEQFQKLLSDPVGRKELCDMVAGQMNQLNDLGLISHKRMDGRNFTISVEKKPEVIFLFANHNPRAEKLLPILKSKDFSNLAEKMSNDCDIKFFVASSAGYAMHDACMIDLDGYIKFLKNIKI